MQEVADDGDHDNKSVEKTVCPFREGTYEGDEGGDGYPRVRQPSRQPGVAQEE